MLRLSTRPPKSRTEPRRASYGLNHNFGNLFAAPAPANPNSGDWPWPTGTCCADDASVRWDEFAKNVDAERNDSCVPTKQIKQMETNSVLLMKGSAWPGIRGGMLIDDPSSPPIPPIQPH